MKPSAIFSSDLEFYKYLCWHWLEDNKKELQTDKWTGFEEAIVELGNQHGFTKFETKELMNYLLNWFDKNGC